MSLALVNLDIPFYTELLKGKCVGFGGKLGSGKSYLADALVKFINETSQIRAVRRSFADELRNTVQDKIGLPVKQMKHNFDRISNPEIRTVCATQLYAHCEKMNLRYDPYFIRDRLAACEVYNDIYRFLLQYVGTELYRMQVDNDYWCNAVGKSLDPSVITIIDDIRFPNELRVVKQNGIAVYAIRLEKLESVTDTIVANHASETSIGAVDFDVQFWNIVNKTGCTSTLGRDVFNWVVVHYYLFKVMQDEPEKEKILQATIKNTCI